MLDAGIDVFSTVNVQHLESLNDQIAELTGTRVRETIPDAVLAHADNVVLIDITPRGADRAPAAGKVYRPDRVQAALNNFFRVENLSALREVALRQVAEEVEAQAARQAAEDAERCAKSGWIDTAAAAAVGERLLALVTLSPAVPACRPPRMALSAAPRRGARPAVDRQARAQARASRSSSRGAPPGVGARRAPAGRGGRRMIDVIARASRRARHDLHTDGDAACRAAGWHA